MSLFFDARWFDECLAQRGLDRGDLAAAAGLDRMELHRLFTNERAATAAELDAFARLLEADLVEVTLRSGVAARGSDADADHEARIESIEARLDAIDSWLAEFEKSKRRA
jgi:DNA-binding Xre family transcriptional regulator